MSGRQQTQMTFDFGFDDKEEHGTLPEVVDIGDAEDSLGLPPSGLPEGEESLSFSSPEEDEDILASESEDAFEEDMQIDGVEIYTGEEAEETLEAEEKNASGDEKESLEEPAKNDEESSGEVVTILKKEKPLPFDAKNIRRAALAFLASLSPDALAADVPTRYRKYVVDGAAFWSRTNKKGKAEVYRTAIIDVLTEADAAKLGSTEEIICRLSEAKNTLEEVKARLRKEEPSLKINDSLFAEEEKWDYSRTKDPAYHETEVRIRELEKALFAGTKFDKLRKSSVATEYYAIVPENLINASSVAEEWGLVYILPDLSFKLVKEAGKLSGTEENMNSLALNIGRMSLQNVLFANGIVQEQEGPKVVRPPRKRRL